MDDKAQEEALEWFNDIDVSLIGGDLPQVVVPLLMLAPRG